MTMSVRLRLTFALLAAALPVAAAAPCHAGSTSTHPSPRLQPAPRVLILNSYHQSFQWTDAAVDAAIDTLRAELGPAEFHVEYMDTKRKLSPQLLDLLRGTYAEKYADIQLDAIIATDDNALQFLLKHGDELFGPVPVVFCGINAYDPALLAGRENYTGLVETLDAEETLALALRLHPGAKTVYVVSDNTPTGFGQRSTVRQAAGAFANVRFVYLNGEDLTTEQLHDRLAALEGDAVVLLTVWLRDKDDRYVPYDLIYPELFGDLRVPVYTLVDLYMGLGVVGGKLNSGRIQGREAGLLVAGILRQGKKAATIPVQTVSANEYIFDACQLERFGIDESRLPPGSTVLNRRFSFYQAYKHLVWSVAGVVTILLLLMALMAVNMQRRRRAEQNLRMLFEGVPDAVFVHDREGRFIFCNQVACRRMGYTREEFLRMGASDIDEEQFGKGFADRLGRQFRDGRLACEGVHVTRDGRKIPVDINTSAITFEGRKAVLAVARDITDRKESEQQRLDMERQLQHAQKLESLGVLAGGIAHDFNNLLVGILGYADLGLAEVSELSPARRSLGEIRKAAVRASELTNQMLAYSGKGRFVVRPIDLNELVREMTHLLEVSISKKTVLRYDLAEELPAVEVDATQMRQVVMNLITNASDAIGDRSGGIILSTGVMEVDRKYIDTTYLSEDLPEGYYAYLEVSDSGCGMDAETRQRIFEPFFTTKFAGRGLGLAAVLGIIRGHRGAVKVYSEPGKGTTFRVLLPCSEKSIESLAPEGPSAAEEGWKADGVVLVVDDEESVRSVAKMMIERRGFVVLTAADGQAALDVFRQRPDEIALVILDMTMPRMNGEETFRELRRIRPGVRVLLTSGYNEQDATNRFAGKGLAGFIQKPFQMDKLLAKVRDILERA